jgi:hypothetical protein
MGFGAHMKRIFTPTTGGSDWQPLLAKPVLHWKKGASAMTTAACWEVAGGILPPEISALFDSSGSPALVGLQLLAAIPEWETPLEGGTTTSHTDVLALCRNERGLCVIAVEAKVNEDFGPLVAEKRRDASPGQSARLVFLQKLLSIHVLDDSIRYQLLHRTAASLLTAELFHASTAVMLVQSFGNNAAVRQDFENFCMYVGAVTITNGLHSVPRESGPSLFLGWCDGNKQFLEVELPSAPTFAGAAPP